MAMAETTREALAAVEYRGEASVLVLADDEAGLDRLSGLAVQAGCRVTRKERLDRAIDWLERPLSADAVLVDAGEDCGAAEEWLARLASQAPHRPSLLAIPSAALDDLSGLFLDSHVEILCNPTSREWLAAIGEATARPNGVSPDVRCGGSGP